MGTGARRRPRAGSVVVLAVRRFWAQDMLHHAGALTYYALLALFNALLLGVALMGLLGTDETLNRFASFLEDNGADRNLVDSLLAAARNAVEAKTTSALALVFAIVVAFWLCSSAFVAASTALNVIVEARDDRSPMRRRVEAVGQTVVAVLLVVGATIAVFLGGDVAREVLGFVGLGAASADVWAIVRYPIAVVLAMTAFAWTYYAAPTVAQPRWRWISLGAAIGVGVWMLASLGLFLFAAQFHTYNATYGAFATAILLIVWLWWTNVALLIGAEINAAGRYAEGASTPISRTGDSPETAQHEAAKRH
jgi:membrane protein